MPITKSRKISKVLDVAGKIKTTVIDSDYIVSSGQKSIISSSNNVALVHSSADTLPVSVATGTQALITSTNSLYMHNSSGWYKIATVNNFNPQWSTEPDSDFTLELISIDSDVKITVYATDSDDVPIIYTAIVDSDFNVAATISHDSDKDNVWIVRRRDSDSGAGTTGNVTFRASDGVNVIQKVVTFTISANTTYVFLGTLESVYSGTVLNLDSDMESLISAGDVLTNAAGSGSEATVSSVSFLDNTYAARTFIGTNYASTVGDPGVGNVKLQQNGTIDSSHVGRVIGATSSNTSVALQYRQGDDSLEGQKINTFSTVAATVTTQASNLYIFGYSPDTNGGFLYNSNGWSSTLGTALPTTALTTNSDGSGAVSNSNAAITTYQGKPTKTHNAGQLSSSFFTYNSIVITYWNGRYNYMEYTNTSGVTYFRCQYDRTSFFTAGALVFPTAALPTAQQVLECYHYVVHSSSYNSGTNETTVYCGNQFGNYMNTGYDPGTYPYTLRTFSTGSVSNVNIGFRKSTNAQPVHYYQGTSTTRNSSMDISYGDTVQGKSLTSNQTLNFYALSAAAHYSLTTVPYVAGNTNMNLGTSNYNMYSWKNVTSAVVDDTTGFTAGDSIYKKIG